MILQAFKSQYSLLTIFDQRHTWKRRQGIAEHRKGNLQIPAWYFKVLTLCLWALYVWIRSPVSTNQHFTVLSALPEYKCRFTSWREEKKQNKTSAIVSQARLGENCTEVTHTKSRFPTQQLQRATTTPWNRGTVLRKANFAAFKIASHIGFWALKTAPTFQKMKSLVCWCTHAGFQWA